MTESEIPGLSVRDEWITPDEERALIASIDASEWRADLQRRVQHYGWRYDYKARSVDESMRLGPLPEWAEALAARIEREGISAKPEQVIVNEYVPGQGISKHVDCVGCFGPVVLSLSLGSACAMELAREGREKVAIKLTARSLLALEDEARTEWTHAIPGRKSDVFDGLRAPRGRRVSVTFRTVKLRSHR